MNSFNQSTPRRTISCTHELLSNDSLFGEVGGLGCATTRIHWWSVTRVDTAGISHTLVYSFTNMLNLCGFWKPLLRTKYVTNVPRVIAVTCCSWIELEVSFLKSGWVGIISHSTVTWQVAKIPLWNPCNDNSKPTFRLTVSFKNGTNYA